MKIIRITILAIVVFTICLLSFNKTYAGSNRFEYITKCLEYRNKQASIQFNPAFLESGLPLDRAVYFNNYDIGIRVPLEVEGRYMFSVDYSLFDCTSHYYLTRKFDPLEYRGTLREISFKFGSEIPWLEWIIRDDTEGLVSKIPLLDRMILFSDYTVGVIMVKGQYNHYNSESESYESTPADTTLIEMKLDFGTYMIISKNLSLKLTFSVPFLFKPMETGDSVYQNEWDFTPTWIYFGVEYVIDLSFLSFL